MTNGRKSPFQPEDSRNNTTKERIPKKLLRFPGGRGHYEITPSDVAFVEEEICIVL
jgi:hypothetical protein